MSPDSFEHDAELSSPGRAAQRHRRGPRSGPAPGDGLEPREEVVGKGSGETAGGSPECGRDSEYDEDISFDPAQFDREGDLSNSPSQKTTTGGEDWLTVNLYVNHGSFESLSDQLDEAQSAAAAGRDGADEVRFGNVRFLMAPRGARQGHGSKAVFMRWRMQSEHGLTLLLLNRAESHHTLANVQIRATSLLLMRYGFERTWQLMQDCVEAMGGEIRANKLSRVDACADLPEVAIAELSRPFNQGWIVSRSRGRGNYAIGTFMNDYLVGKDPTGFTVGKAPLMLRAYDKLRESNLDTQKLAVLKAHRWDGTPTCATRVEFELHRTKLKQFGVDTVDHWRAKRSDILDVLTRDWFRLTAGPVDRKHADRVEMHPAWDSVREAFAGWTGAPAGAMLSPLPPLWLGTTRQMAMVVGILKGNFAKVGTLIGDNEQFYREAMFGIRQAVGDRDMAKEIERKALELGANSLHPQRDDVW